MKLKQKITALSLAISVALLGSVAIAPSAYALSKDKFVSILCDDFSGPSTSGGTKADECRRDARDGTLSKKWYDKTIKFSDWKDKTANQLYRHIGKTPPADTGDDGGGGGIITDPTDGDDCGGVKTSIIKCNANNEGSDTENNGIWALLLIVLNIMTAGVGVLAIAGIVYGAILYTTAEDKADQVKKATDIIQNVIIGLVAFALMWSLLNFLVPGGVFA